MAYVYVCGSLVHDSLTVYPTEAAWRRSHERPGCTLLCISGETLESSRETRYVGGEIPQIGDVVEAAREACGKWTVVSVDPFAIHGPDTAPPVSQRVYSRANEGETSPPSDHRLLRRVAAPPDAVRIADAVRALVSQGPLPSAIRATIRLVAEQESRGYSCLHGVPLADDCADCDGKPEPEPEREVVAWVVKSGWSRRWKALAKLAHRGLTHVDAAEEAMHAAIRERNAAQDERDAARAELDTLKRLHDTLGANYAAEVESREYHEAEEKRWLDLACDLKNQVSRLETERDEAVALVRRVAARTDVWLDEDLNADARALLAKAGAR